jgi:hypothetical protein
MVIGPHHVRDQASKALSSRGGMLWVWYVSISTDDVPARFPLSFVTLIFLFSFRCEVWF